MNDDNLKTTIVFKSFMSSFFTFFLIVYGCFLWDEHEFAVTLIAFGLLVYGFIRLFTAHVFWTIKRILSGE